MHLLRLRRMIQDEGVVGALRMARNLLRDGEARQRVLEMRKVLERYCENLRGILIVAQKGS